MIPSLAALALLLPAAVLAPVQTPLLEADFESGSLDGWTVTRPDFIRIEDTGDATRGLALRMTPGGPWTHALLEGSEAWGPVRIDGVVRFPTDEHNYLGFIWGLVEEPDRTDFASLYIKGNDSYVRINHRYDGNPLRSLHEERRTALEGPRTVRVGAWQPFRLEVDGTVAHLYFGSMDEPVVTSHLYMGPAGRLGFKPRVIGGDVWIDDVVVTPIPRLTYGGAPRPDIAYARTHVFTDWRVLGPTIDLHPELGPSPDPTAMDVSDMGRTLTWAPFDTDARGAVLTSRVVQFRGPATRAYFATTFVVEEGGPSVLSIASIDDLTVWLDGRFHGYYTRSRYAWHDFLTNPDHAGLRASGELEPGEHRLLIEVRGALYAGGGFFAGLTRPD